MVARKLSPPLPLASAAAIPATSGKPDLTLRPLMRARQASLFEREVSEKLTRSAIELLFGAADVLSEGQKTVRGGREAFLGSTMLTIELRSLVAVFREATDARAAQRLGVLLTKDVGARARARALATKEIERLTGARPRAIETEVRVRARGTTIYVDVDVEANF